MAQGNITMLTDDREFWDDQEGGSLYGRSMKPDYSSKDYFDNATPSGNSVAADVLLRWPL